MLKNLYAFGSNGVAYVSGVWTARFIPVFTAAILAFTPCLTPVNAQTRFEDPQRAINIAQYHTVEHCLAAVHRMERVWLRGQTARYDTMPPGISERSVPWSRAIVEIAQRCSAQWQAATAPVVDFSFLAELFLVAERDADMKVLLMRRFEEVMGRTDSVWWPVLDTAIELYMRARPTRLWKIDSLLTGLTLLPDGTYPKEYLLRKLWVFRDLAEELGHDSTAMRAAVMADDLFTGLTSEERGAGWYNDGMVGYNARKNSRLVHRRERLDSLRKGTTPYVNLYLAQEKELFKGGNPIEEVKLNIGSVSPSVDGDFWFPAKPDVPRPTRGKRSLIVPSAGCWRSEELSQNNGKGNDGSCVTWYSILKRLHARFPDVEITVLTFQDGRAILHEPGKAEDEAEDIRRWLLEGVKLPITLAVEQADFVQLPNPDSRMINTRWTLAAMQDWECSVGNNIMFCPYMILVDESGIILGRFFKGWYESGMLEEKRLTELLDALAQRAR